MKPLISCLMVTQPGRERTIRKALACFRRQTYEPRELVIVHDASGRSGSLPWDDRECLLDRFLRRSADAARIVRVESGKSLGELGILTTR